MTAIIDSDCTDSTDSLLRFAMRADAVAHRPMPVSPAFRSRAGCQTLSGTTLAFEYSMSAFFIAYGVAVFGSCCAAVGSAARASP